MFPSSHCASPLFVACAVGDLERVEALLVKGADVNLPVDECWLPLLIACQNSQLDYRDARMLLQHGAEIDKAMLASDTALFVTCQYGLLGCACLLLENGAGVDVPGRDGVTPSLVASQNASFSSRVPPRPSSLSPPHCRFETSNDAA